MPDLKDASRVGVTPFDLAQRYQRAIALIQLLLSTNIEVQLQAEDEARQQLKEWGVRLPTNIPDHEDEGEA